LIQDEHHWLMARHEILMSIGNSLTLHDMLQEAMGVVLRALDCTSVSVLHQEGLHPEAQGYSVTYRLPRDAPHLDEAMPGLTEALTQTPWPCPLATREGHHFYAWPLPEYGVLLVSRHAVLTPDRVHDLQSLADKLAVSIHACLQYAKAQAAQHQIAKNEQRWLKALEGAGHGVWDWDTQTNELFLSPVWASMLGYEAADIGHQFTDWSERVHPDDLPSCLAAVEKHLRGESPAYQHEYRMRCKDGSYKWVSDQGRAWAWDHDNLLRMSGTLTDITQHIEYENTLREARRLAEAANQTKDAFLAAMSHELRTPMNAIIGFTDLSLGTALTDKQGKYLAYVKASSQRLLAMINDIFDLSSTDRSSIRPQDCALHEYLEIITHESLPLAQERHIDLRLEVTEKLPPCVRLDVTRVRKILTNLLDNGIKFTEHGSVCLRVDIEDAGTDPLLHFSVQDTGIGIAAEDQIRIFSAFTQVDSTLSRRYDGTGLSLTLSERLATLMGGHITLESRLGEGSTFTLTLPLTPCHISI